MGSGSAWLLRFCVVPGWWNVGWLVCFCGAVDGTVSCFGFQDDRTGVVFPNSQEQEGDGGSGRPELCFAWNLGFGLPAEKLRSDEESENGPAEERQGFGPKTPDGSGKIDGVLQTPDEIGGGKKDAKSLRRFGQVRQRHCRT